MRTLHVTKVNFMEWYYFREKATIQDEIAKSFGNMMMHSLLRDDQVKVSVREIFEMSCKDIIPLRITEELKHSPFTTETMLDLGVKVELKLI